MSSNTAQSTGFSRRTALKLFGAGAGTVGLGTLGIASPAAASTVVPAASDTGYWNKVREMFTLDKRILYMNVGTVGSPPRQVLDVVDAVHRQVARDAEASYSDFADVRAVIAKAHGVDTDEIVITHNTSDGMSKALLGLNLRVGDEILTTNHEHSGGDTPLALARDRYGVVIKRVELPIGDDQVAEDYVELFRAGITGRTKVIMFSAPTYLTGTMLPIRMLAELAQQHGIITVVDGAHIPGMMAYDFRELGVDFLAGAGAKWQCAPGGTGILYIRNRVTAANPTPLPEFWPMVSSGYPRDESVDLRSRDESQDIGKYAQSIGNGTKALNAGVKKAGEIWDEIGRQRIQDRVVGLADRTKELIVERWGIQSLYSAKSDTRLTCALTGFNPFQNPADVKDSAKSAAFVSRLLDEYGIEVRNTSLSVIGDSAKHSPLRVSTHLFHQPSDVDRLIDAAWKLSKKMA
ncbi:isopenicillin-N epimerase [Microbacterium sp. W4I4]|uniref:aminotransferase class V-fold PLP-dependent enzyme n=1 Tax=Microbacterium sp. W4I4 TaxID=3042295 RepID=UPI002783A9A9|nr:aminotransferase class V-fold PLP-dependent enzyme [Microbacterium sp. W4I4]MDQ0613827.1 isopenicillin-N epimerase [Microbacterium sp. W4I4]